MPSNYPRAPAPLLAILAAPITWLYGRPDLFDSYRSALGCPALTTPWVADSNGLRHACVGGRSYGLLVSSFASETS